MKTKDNRSGKPAGIAHPNGPYQLWFSHDRRRFLIRHNRTFVAEMADQALAISYVNLMNDACSITDDMSVLGPEDRQ